MYRNYCYKMYLSVVLFLAALVICSVFCCKAANAVSLSFSWDPNTDVASGYKLLMDSGTNAVADIQDADTTIYTYVLDNDEECHSFALVAYNTTGESAASDFVVWCPKRPQPVQKFIMTLESIE